MFKALHLYAEQLVEFVHLHEQWAAPVSFVFSFGESLAFVSLLFPAWAALIGIGALVGAGHLNFWPVWIAAALGAALGDWLSYWLGVKIGPAIANIWPLSRRPNLLPQGHAFVRQWGTIAVFAGRFFGPLRASVPIAAGVLRMPYWHFQIANVFSALVWAGVLLVFGDFLRAALNWIFD